MNNKSTIFSNGIARLYDARGRLSYALTHAKTSIFNNNKTVYQQIIDMMGTIIWSCENILNISEQTFNVDMNKYQKLEMYVLDDSNSANQTQKCITFLPRYNVEICGISDSMTTYTRDVKCISIDENNICTYKIFTTDANTTNVPICVIGYPINTITN